MRIQILADVGKGLTLPINYNYQLAGTIYGFLSCEKGKVCVPLADKSEGYQPFRHQSNTEYTSFLHNEGYLAAQKRFKLFTFSQLMAKRRRINGAHIHFRSPLTWYVSSPIEEFLSHFADILLTEGRLTLAPHHLTITDVTIPRAPRFHTEMHFRYLSPIVLI